MARKRNLNNLKTGKRRYSDPKKNNSKFSCTKQGRKNLYL